LSLQRSKPDLNPQRREIPMFRWARWFPSPLPHFVVPRFGLHLRQPRRLVPAHPHAPRRPLRWAQGMRSASCAISCWAVSNARFRMAIARSCI